MRNFAVKVLIFVILIVLGAIALVIFYQKSQWLQLATSIAFILYISYLLYVSSTGLNLKMKRLFEAIQYQDFAITFKNDNALGSSFTALNNELNDVIKSFNQVRAEREASLHFVQAIVQQINVGILAYDVDGKIEIVNQTATSLLSAYRLLHMTAIEKQKPQFYKLIKGLKQGEPKLITINDQELSFSVTEILQRGKKLRLVAIHNIKNELQIRELEAWQNLTKVLRHEIMNSITPIVSMAETMQEIVENDLNTSENKEPVEDLKQALQTIKKRSKGIMKFVNAYREFTNIPSPTLHEITIDELFENLKLFFKKSLLKEAQPQLFFEIDTSFKLMVDAEQIEQVLINIIKNALEAKYENIPGKVVVRASFNNKSKKIEVVDNGVGVDPNHIDKIFIPFFTSKVSGSGVGLSLSRQIIQNHGGQLSYQKNNSGGSVFKIEF